MSSNWRAHAHKLLDDAERGGTDQKPTMSGIARSIGVNRISLWRDVEIRERFERLSSRQKGSSVLPKSRRTTDQRVRALTLQIVKLESENDRLLQTFIIICRRLNEKGIEPTTVLGRVTPTKLNDAWTAKILKWDEI